MPPRTRKTGRSAGNDEANAGRELDSLNHGRRAASKGTGNTKKTAPRKAGANEATAADGNEANAGRELDALRRAGPARATKRKRDDEVDEEEQKDDNDGGIVNDENNDDDGDENGGDEVEEGNGDEEPEVPEAKTEAKKPSATRAAPKKSAPKKSTTGTKKTAATKAADATKKADTAKKSTAAKKAEGAKNPPATKKPAAVKKAAPSKTPAVADEDGERPAKKPRTEKSAARVKAAPKQKLAPKEKPVPKRAAAPRRGLGARGIAFNEVPKKQFDIFVFGEGSSGELGLGSKKYDGKKPIDVKRPRINHNLKGVVAIACGGMHCIALTHDQRILTWGVNDDKALGRDTFWEGGVRDVDNEDDSEDDEDDTGINPRESTPGEVDLSGIPEGTLISQVAATDSASFVLTDDGWVYGWGTFRGSEGIIGFSEQVRTQPTPIIIPGLKNITKLACGSNHVLAIDLVGKVFSWGSGGQFQLGRKPLTRLGGPSSGLNPQPCGKFSKKHFAVRIGAGSYHSFYIDNDDRVWSWGLNNYAQTGLSDDTGEDDAMVLQPQIVQSFKDLKISDIVGGEHHSVAYTNDGQLLTWGRVDGHQVGHPSGLYTEENAVFDDNKKPRILFEPTAIEGIKTNFIAAGTDTSFALDEGGKVYSWGFSANYQTGQGTTEDIEIPTVIDNSAIRDRKIVWAGAGGQFSMLAAHAEDDQMTNGH
ncbi:regulator of chromosome condensation 1/beta-lactamase-inhibitor protein II [Hypoxylon sp. NC1633]|nr:regulator of chromosome condensation 1/beta-lactamase-inhibitor protein II [Hypoxylon sp. NC1633]